MSIVAKGSEVLEAPDAEAAKVLVKLIEYFVNHGWEEERR